MTYLRASWVGVFLFLVSLATIVSLGGCAGRRPQPSPQIVGASEAKRPTTSGHQNDPGAAAGKTRALPQRPPERRKPGSEIPDDAPVGVMGDRPSAQQPAGTAGSYSVLESHVPVAQPDVTTPEPRRPGPLKLALQAAGEIAERRRSLFVLVLLGLSIVAALLFVRSRRVP
jgi:hypothetical protein